ncbi:hypothetical protein MPTK1_4g17190 [Marchantia polymorpha subsp. ruderalis]|uniref:Uncharacterized protein n=2 Tax=Marchantia polymorpha TaxID=3197 RepID=A0AAF6BAS2_MARPO|nr:hypothetical protein MARPO_0041s0001 [Marchantia polymorpha]BBN09106.1 hypothetical protein Mp_4g17190 [Marchantia polymorpha subsp. ruderalis]|eukprot:PTQ40094.1 hypothetical protein MARPO_0041s0001 [Marchantia polymorpha]
MSILCSIRNEGALSAYVGHGKIDVALLSSSSTSVFSIKLTQVVPRQCMSKTYNSSLGFHSRLRQACTLRDHQGFKASLARGSERGHGEINLDPCSPRATIKA